VRSTLTIILTTIVVVSAAARQGSSDDASFYLRLARSLESFGAVMREVSTTYVDDVDPEDLAEVGIDAMLQHLDPYSVYMRGDESEDVDMLTTGNYVGFGISVGRRDSVLTIVDVREDGPAVKAGIRVGDRLLTINDVRTDTMSPASLRPHTRGAIGSRATLRILREGRRDTLTLTITRSELPVQTVSHSEILPGSIAYVRVERFARGTGVAVRKALGELRDRTDLRGIIIDLRDNPGGLLDAAVDLVELFVPRNSVIVSTRGRDASERRTYSSNEDPIEPTVPLAVLINEGSASASEIVAGAIQDLDRGIIIGKRSFGKGLVQTVVPLPNDATLKLTTSRYYTPSGRTIQRIDYRSKRMGTSGEPSGTITGLETGEPNFTTANGRRLSHHNGIDPDTAVSDSILPGVVAYLDRSDLIGRFATVWSSTRDSLPAGFKVDRTVFDEFMAYVDASPAQKRSPLLRELADARQRALNAGWSAPSLKSIESAERALEREVSKTLRSHQAIICERLEQEIRTRFGNDRARATRALRIDPMVQAARSILASPAYQAILGVQVPTDQ
jgi:carboxyl-terminal processing protease